MIRALFLPAQAPVSSTRPRSRFSAPNLFVSRCRWRLSPNDYFGTALPTLAPLCDRSILQTLQPAVPIKQRLGCLLVSYLPSHITSRRKASIKSASATTRLDTQSAGLPLSNPDRPISPPHLFAPDLSDFAGLRCFSIGPQFDVELLLI